MWVCYVIWSGQDRTCRTYAGCTNNFSRRLRQHRGELKGGAKSTSGRSDWAPLYLVHGFLDMRSALRFEWRLKQHRGWFRNLGGTSIDRRYRLLNEALKWSHHNLGQHLVAQLMTRRQPVCKCTLHPTVPPVASDGFEVYCAADIGLGHGLRTSRNLARGHGILYEGDETMVDPHCEPDLDCVTSYIRDGQTVWIDGGARTCLAVYANHCSDYRYVNARLVAYDDAVRLELLYDTPAKVPIYIDYGPEYAKELADGIPGDAWQVPY